MPMTRDFISLRRNVKKQYFGKKVPRKYQTKYGKRYGKKAVESISYAIARKRGIKIDKGRRRK